MRFIPTAFGLCQFGSFNCYRLLPSQKGCFKNRLESKQSIQTRRTRFVSAGDTASHWPRSAEQESSSQTTATAYNLWRKKDDDDHFKELCMVVAEHDLDWIEEYVWNVLHSLQADTNLPDDFVPTGLTPTTTTAREWVQLIQEEIKGRETTERNSSATQDTNMKNGVYTGKVDMPEANLCAIQPLTKVNEGHAIQSKEMMNPFVSGNYDVENTTCVEGGSRVTLRIGKSTEVASSIPLTIKPTDPPTTQRSSVIVETAQESTTNTKPISMRRRRKRSKQMIDLETDRDLSDSIAPKKTPFDNHRSEDVTKKGISITQPIDASDCDSMAANYTLITSFNISGMGTDDSSSVSPSLTLSPHERNHELPTERDRQSMYNVTLQTIANSSKDYRGLEKSTMITNMSQSLLDPKKEAVPAVTNTPKTSVTIASSSAPPAVDQMSSNELMVLFSDPEKNEWRAEPLMSLEELGYDCDDVRSLDPDVLQLILGERLMKPRAGIPARWRSSIEGSIQLVSIDTAETFLASMEQERKNRGRTKDLTPREEERSPGSGPPFVKDAVEQLTKRDKRKFYGNDAKGSVSSEQVLRLDKMEEQTRAETIDVEPGPSSFINETTARREPELIDQVGRSSNTEDDVEFRRKQTWREERRRQRVAESRGKKVYSGRPGPQPRAGRTDNPPPPKGFWPDIDSFRSMLRNEAEFRLRILGDDWSRVVKDESDWRLNLYKDWLWLLQTGVGEPMVESRSDRQRRRQHEMAMAAARQSRRRRTRKKTSPPTTRDE